MNKHQISLIIVQLFAVIVFVVVLIPRFIEADHQTLLPVQQTNKTAELEILPRTESYDTGETFPIQILVHTEGNDINAVGAYIKYNPTIIEVLKVDTSNSFCTLFPETKFDNSTGKLRIACGLPSPGFNGNFGHVATVFLRFKDAGVADLTFSTDSSVLANDGQGTNLLAKTSNSTLSANRTESTNLKPISKEVAEIPEDLNEINIISSTHPSQARWYSSNEVVLNWANSQNVSGYSYLLDQSHNTQPDPTLVINETSKTCAELENGTWYFHIRPISEYKAGPVTHYKVNIDRSPPSDLEIVNTIEAEDTLTLEYTVEDILSGIDSVEVDYLGITTTVTNPITINKSEVGSSPFLIRAIDNAGNFSEIEYTIEDTEDKNIFNSIFKFFENLFKNDR